MKSYRLDRVRLSALVAMSLVAAVACRGEGADDVAPGDPAAIAGTTDQGFHVRLEPLDGRRVRVDVEADCAEQDGDRRPLARRDEIDPPADDHELAGPVAEDGRFEIDHSYGVDSTDGVTGEVEIRVEGRFVSDGTAAGTLDAHQVWHDPQHDELFDECSTGTIRWRADEPPALAPGDYVEIPLDGVATLLPHGHDLLAIVQGTEAPEGDLPAVVTIDGSSSEVGERRSLAATGGGSAVIDQAVLASVGGGMWTVVGHERATLVRTDLASGRQSTPVETGEMLALAGGLDALWTLSKHPGPRSDVRLEKRDPESGHVMRSVRSRPGVLAIGPSSLWHVDADDGRDTATRIDPATLDTIESFSFDVDLPGVADTGASADEIWMLSRRGDLVVILDAVTGEVAFVEIPVYGSSLAVDEEGAWITHPREDVIRRIESGEITRTVGVPERLNDLAGASDIAVTEDGTSWLAGENQVLRLDPATLGG